MISTPTAPSANDVSTTLPAVGPVTSAMRPRVVTPAKSSWPLPFAAPPTTTTGASAVPLPERPPTLSVKSTRCVHYVA